MAGSTLSVVAQADASAAAAKRHSWVRVKVHVYICQQCGCGRVHEDLGRGSWQTKYHKPDGTSQLIGAPRCEVGPLSAAYLGKYESAIAMGGLPKEKGD